MPQNGMSNERFRIMTPRNLRLAHDLLTKPWIDKSSVRPTPWRAIGRPIHAISNGDWVCDLHGVPGPLIEVPAPQTGAVPTMHVVGSGGRLRSVVGFNPLIFYAVFGSNQYYRCLELALTALDKYGRYEDPILIGADRPRSAVAQYIPDPFKTRWIYHKTTADAKLFGRYELTEWQLKGFGPILYMDVDVVADAPIQPLLHELAVSPKLHVATENRLVPALMGRDAIAYAATDFGNWFGTWLCKDDARFRGIPFRMGSSGIMGFASINGVYEVFSIVQSLRRIADATLISTFTDQSLLNYALHCSGIGDFQLLDKYTEFARGFDSGLRSRSGMMHFHSGFGNADAKFQAMSDYLNALSRKSPSSSARLRSRAR